jgi:hypothetical protein
MLPRHRFQKLFGLALVLSALWLRAASASSSCFGDQPLVTGYSVDEAPLIAPSFMGEWRLPISSDDPDIITAALVRVDVLPKTDDQGALLSMSFSFPDPYPLGLPFTFERAEFSWESHGKKYTAQIDWSDDCSSPGRSMFPHDSWTASIDLSENSENLVFEHPVFRLWGSRN